MSEPIERKIPARGCDRPALKLLNRYVRKDASLKWHDLGLELLEQEDEGTLDEIQINNTSNASDCCKEMFQLWLRRCPNASWDRLISALKVPIIGLNSLATTIENMLVPMEDTTCPVIKESVNYDHFNIENLDFASYSDVTDAFALLISIFEEELPATKFEAIRLNCLHRGYRVLQDEISRTANNHDLLRLLLSHPIYLNWMKIDYLKTMAVAAKSQVLQDTLQGYRDAILSKTLGEVWNVIPSFYKTKKKFYFKVKAQFRGKNPNHVKIEHLRKFKPRFASKIAIDIMQIGRGSLTITWCVMAEEAYQAYLLSLMTPQEFREDEFLQIGPWVVHHPQSVLQELNKQQHVMKSTATLLIAYYHDLLLRDINADLLTDKMSSAGLLTDTEVSVISSGHSVHYKNWLLLEHVRHMNVQALTTFCELLQEMWPEIGLQLITALKFESSSVSSEFPVDTLETKQNNVELMESDRTSCSLHILFLCLIDQVAKLLESFKPELIQQCSNLKASDIHNISLFSTDKMKELSVSNNPLVILSPLFSWSNHSILKALVSCSDEASKLLDNLESKLDYLETITSYPIPCLSSNMIPTVTDTSTYTILAVRCDEELYKCTLQYVYDVQSVMIEKCDITQHCLQLLAVRSDPTILYWTIPKCVVDLINTNVPLHSEYLCSRGILEVLVYPDLLLTTGDDVCYGKLAFECGNQLLSKERVDLAISHQEKERKLEDLLRNAYQKETGEIRRRYDLLLEENAKLQYQLEIMHKQLEQLQVDYVKNIDRYRKFKDDGVAIQTDMGIHEIEETAVSGMHTEDSGIPLKKKIKMEDSESFPDYMEIYQKELTEMKQSSDLLHEKNDKLQSQLSIASKQLKQLQEENKKVVTQYMELKDKQRHNDTMILDYQKELTEMKLSSKVLHEKNDELQSQLSVASKQLKQLQEENKKVDTQYMELKDKQRHSDTMTYQEERKLSSFLREKNDELQSQLDDVHKQLEQLQVENKKIVSIYMDKGKGNDSDDTEETFKVNFSAYDNVSDAFAELFTICQRATKVSSEEFRTIRNTCVAYASEPLRGLMKCATDTHCLFEILADNNKYCNWMNVSFLKVIAIACGNKNLQSLIENYTDAIYSKEIWGCIPYSKKAKYYHKIRNVNEEDPYNITVKELMKSSPQLAREIALLIAKGDYESDD